MFVFYILVLLHFVSFCILFFILVWALVFSGGPFLFVYIDFVNNEKVAFPSSTFLYLCVNNMVSEPRESKIQID